MTHWKKISGLTLLIVVFAHFYHNYLLGTPGNILWVCHISNLLLSAGLITNQAFPVRVSVPWIILGIPLWVMDMWLSETWMITSLSTHLLGLLIALMAIYHYRARGTVWIYSWLYFLFFQLLAKLLTSPELNVNVSHSIYGGMEHFIEDYRIYWMIIALFAALCLWLVNYILSRLFPQTDQAEIKKKRQFFVS